MTTKQSKGLILIDNQQTSDTASGLQLPAAVFFTRTHFDIFGLFFPLALPDLPSAVTFIADLYLHAGVKMDLQSLVGVVSKSHGAETRWPQVWQQELDTLTRYVYVDVDRKCRFWQFKVCLSYHFWSRKVTTLSAAFATIMSVRPSVTVVTDGRTDSSAQDIEIGLTP